MAFVVYFRCGTALVGAMSVPPFSSVQRIRTQVRDLFMHSLLLPDAGEEGEVSSFVLVHGLGMSTRYMMPTAEMLSRNARVHVVDLPGFGESDRPGHVLTIPQLADALAVWLGTHQLNRPCLLGNSLGAQVIVDLCARYPGCVGRAVLIAPTIDPSARSFTTQLFRLMADTLREPPRLLLIGMRDYLRAGFLRTARTLRHALIDPVEQKLPLLVNPVLIVRGGRDPIVPQPWVEIATGLTPGARLVIIPTAAHAVNFSSPAALTHEVMKFLHEENAPHPLPPEDSAEAFSG